VRFARLHPTFTFLLVVALVGIAGSIVVSLASSDACDQVSQPDARCTLAAQSHENTALVLAIGSLTLMVSAVGFQIGRAGSGWA
jgi:hypothetical protein